MNFDPTAFSQNPFAVVTIIAAPAILTNASSILILSTSNRLMRCLDRISHITQSLDQGQMSDALKHMYFNQVDLSQKQAQYFLNALRAAYLSLASFALASFFALLGAVANSTLSHYVIDSLGAFSLMAGGLGVFGLIWASANLIKASNITMVIIRSDMDHLKRHRPLLP